MQSPKDVLTWAAYGLGLFVIIMLITACSMPSRYQPPGEDLWRGVPSIFR